MLQSILNNTNNKNWDDAFDRVYTNIDDTDKLINVTNKYEFNYTSIENSGRRWRRPLNVPFYWRDKSKHEKSDKRLKKLGVQALYNARYRIKYMQQLRDAYSKSYQFKMGYVASKAHYHFKILASVRHTIANREKYNSQQYRYSFIQLNNVFYDLDVDFDWLMHFLLTAFQRHLENKKKEIDMK